MGTTGWIVTLAIVAGLPVAGLLWVRRGQPEERPRLSPGRFFLLFSILFSVCLLLTEFVGAAAALFLVGFLMGLLGTGRLMGWLYRMLYGADWLSRNPTAVERDAQRWHLPMLIGGVLLFTAAILTATFGLR